MKRFLLLLLAAGCAHQARLVPAADANRLPDGSAVVSTAGVEVSVDSHRWSGSPSDLPTIVTPLFVSLRNGSATPVRVRYRNFTLTGPSGLSTAAIPPFRLQRPGTEVVALAPAFAPRRFFVFGAYHRFFPGLPVWAGPWDYDPWFYDSSYRTWEPSLPTPSMLQQALPEGVLQPGGEAAGFLYFHHLRDSGALTFSAEIVEADSRVPIGSVQIPMVLQ